MQYRTLTPYITVATGWHLEEAEPVAEHGQHTEVHPGGIAQRTLDEGAHPTTRAPSTKAAETG
jgi:hypothetical protein